MRRISSGLVLAAVVLAVLAAVAAAPAAATRVISHKTIRNARIPAGTHDVVYDHCRFVGGGATRAVLELTNACHDITFRYCVIGSGPWNGISINDRGGNIYNIKFVRCRILPRSAWASSAPSGPVSATTGYHGIQVIGCVFSPQGSEAISFDGGTGCVGNRCRSHRRQGSGRQ